MIKPCHLICQNGLFLYICADRPVLLLSGQLPGECQNPAAGFKKNRCLGTAVWQKVLIAC